MAAFTVDGQIRKYMAIIDILTAKLSLGISTQ
jgi:hypothetical protein